MTETLPRPDEGMPILALGENPMANEEQAMHERVIPFGAELMVNATVSKEPPSPEKKFTITLGTRLVLPTATIFGGKGDTRNDKAKD